MPLKITSIQPVVKETEAGLLINVNYEGELPDGTTVSRTLMGVQEGLLLGTAPVERLKELVIEDMRRIWRAKQAEEARRTALETLAREITTATIETPIEAPEVPPPPEEEVETAEETAETPEETT